METIIDPLILLLYISAAIFTGYVISMWITHGIHTSISASWYSLEEKNKFLFTLWCWGFAVPLTIAGMAVGGGWLTFFSGAFIALVGAAPRNMDGANQFLSDRFNIRKHEKVVHKAAAYSGVLLSQAALFVDFGEWKLNIIFLVFSLLLMWRSKHHIWWIEILAYFLFFYTIAKLIL